MGDSALMSDVGEVADVVGMEGVAIFVVE